ncbi:hypothetical protein GCM10023349_36910 [Nocardioides conyzicola]|uniref:Uncharacterized protein n=1 Tax=Nocardioides conyzicola TaxID=1651781 RepID=A0ABP8XW01_9ACTN
MCSTSVVAVTHLSGSNGRIEFTLDGLTFRRTRSAAAARGVGRLHQVGWSAIDRATVTSSATGKPVLEIQVVGAAPVERRKHDPHALKLKRGMGDEARGFADLVNHEVATRRRWQSAAAVDA